MPLDLSHLSAGDAVTALRSYPRRYRAALQSFDGDDNIETLARRSGPDGGSAIDAAVDTVRSFGLLGQALAQVLRRDQPVLHAGVVDPAERVWPGSADDPVDALLRELDDESRALADAIAHTDASEWSRTGSVAGSDRTVTAFDIVREAVQTGSDNLRKLESAMTSARR
jgi:hypothetical protein